MHHGRKPLQHKINNANPLYFFIDKVNGYIEESNGNKYLTVIATEKIKHTMKKYEELWNKIRDLT